MKGRSQKKPKSEWAKALKPLSIQTCADMLNRGENFSLARYGDGEWLTILGVYGKKNSNGCTFTRELSNDLRQVLYNRRPYMHSTLRIAVRKYGHVIETFMKVHNLEMEWYKGDHLLDQSLNGNAWKLVQALRKKRIVYIGPAHCRGLRKVFFPYMAYIQPPPQNAITERDRVILAVKQAISKTNAQVVGWSSGLASKVFIDDIYEIYGDEITQIDFGSMWDGYFCNPTKPQGDKTGSRSYIRRGKILWDDLLAVNSGKRPKREGETFRVSYEGIT